MRKNATSKAAPTHPAIITMCLMFNFMSFELVFDELIDYLDRQQVTSWPTSVLLLEKHLFVGSL